VATRSRSSTAGRTKTSAALPAISVTGLHKSYGDREVVRDVSFDVGVGECFGLLGHNGAGKTTTIEILEGYLARDSGSVSVLNTDPARATNSWRQRIGIVPQKVEVFPTLTVAETVRMFADLYPAPRPVGETVDLVGLETLSSTRAGKLSGGERRRLDIALGLVGDPELLFLDEPTTGLDPSARRETWSMIEALKVSGVTIVLTTHYMDEAQVLADRLLILRQGVVAAAGTYDELVRRHGDATTISFRLPADVTIDAVRDALDIDVRPDGTRVEFTSTASQRDLYRLLWWADRHRVALDDLTVERTSLEDVFLTIGDRQPEVATDHEAGTPR
jgi:ABC-2 type transport system ATP-binding protein